MNIFNDNFLREKSRSHDPRIPMDPMDLIGSPDPIGSTGICFFPLAESNGIQWDLGIHFFPLVIF